MFTKYDEDKSGTINSKEFANLLINFSKSMNLEPPTKR